MPSLPPAFTTVPLAHRGLHDRSRGVVENSHSAIDAAVAAGYGIELDLQLSADGEAMVFHDDELMRLTGEPGPVRDRTARALGQTRLLDSDETIPTLADILAMVAGRVPLLIEIKDQSLTMGPVDGRLERRACRLLAAYPGAAALMSFNPHSVAICRDTAPDIARGRVTCAFTGDYWAHLDMARRRELAVIDDLDALGCSFISHQHSDLQSAEVSHVSDEGKPILCWTVRSAGAERAAREIAANVTFEGYLAEISA
ncbi:MAG: glycerophosphodiester phosphodiesterase family protein [Pseudomonadota bacterium]